MRKASAQLILWNALNTHQHTAWPPHRPVTRLAQVERLDNFQQCLSLTDRCVKGNESCGVDRHTPQEAYCLCAAVSSETSDSLVHVNLEYSCLLKFNTNRAQTQQSKANLMTRCGCDVVQVSLIRTFSAQIILAVSPWKHWDPEGAHLDSAVDRECWL